MLWGEIQNFFLNSTRTKARCQCQCHWQWQQLLAILFSDFKTSVPLLSLLDFSQKVFCLRPARSGASLCHSQREFHGKVKGTSMGIVEGQQWDLLGTKSPWDDNRRPGHVDSAFRKPKFIKFTNPRDGLQLQ